MLNLEGHHGSASVRVFVEDTTGRRWRRRPPEPKVRLRISDCANEVSLWFDAIRPSPSLPLCPLRSPSTYGHQ